MKNVLLVDTNFSSAPIYNYIKQAGYNVFVCGGNRYDFLAKSSENYLAFDYSNISKIQQAIRDLHIDYLVPGCNDFSYQVCAEVNAEGVFYGLDEKKSTVTINNKEKFREIAIQLNLPVPKVITPENSEQLWPIIVKPVDAYSGRGVKVIHKEQKNMLPEALQQAEEFSRTNTCIVEEYIEGQLYSHSAFIVEGKIQVDFIVEEHGSANSFVVDTSRVLYNFSRKLLLRIREAIERLSGGLKLADGLIHTQFIRKENALWLIEVTRRCPGDLYSQLIELSTEFPYAAYYAKPFLNQPITIKNTLSHKQNHVLRHTISLPAEDVFSFIKFNRSIKIKEFTTLALSGDKVKESPFGRIALLFAQAESEKEIFSLMDAALKRELYSTNL